MAITEKIYDADPRTTSFKANVLTCSQEEDGFWLELDRTAFFPEEGGQYADLGTINKEPVTDVQIRENRIFHKTARPFMPHTEITGEVDWRGRFDNMQQHSGEHIISGLVHRHFGYDNVGFHLGREEVTLDFNGILTQEELGELEREANEAVYANLEILVSFPSKEALSALSYRSKKELEGTVRIVEIPGYDVCACCAPHVARTGEIGIIRICGVMRHRSGVRVNILCGMRALKDYRSKSGSVSSVSVLLSAKPEDITNAVSRLQSENTALRERLCDLQARFMQNRIDALPDDQNHVLLFEPDLDTVAARKTVNLLTGRYRGYCGVFTGNDGQGYHYIIGSSSLDCRAAANLLKTVLGSRGGGTSAMVQGSVTAAEAAIRELFV